MLGYQARAMRRGLSKLGEPSLLDGVECGRVTLHLNVDVFPGIGDTAEDNSIVRYTVAAIDTAVAPEVGQTLVHPDGTFVLDRLVNDNGAVRSFIVVAS